MGEVILVNEKDEAIGTMEKMQAHREGLLHRAFSIFLFNDNNEMLLQQRATTKYHSPNLWTNTCCSHPAPGESLEQATRRRLVEECGLSNIELQQQFSFIYKTNFENGLMEHELDYVFTGLHNTLPQIIREEASAYRFVSLQDLIIEVEESPSQFTVWFQIALPRLIEKLSVELR